MPLGNTWLCTPHHEIAERQIQGDADLKTAVAYVTQYQFRFVGQKQ